MTKQAEGFCYGIIICFILFMLLSILPGSLGMITSFQLGNNSFNDRAVVESNGIDTGEAAESFVSEKSENQELGKSEEDGEESITYAWETRQD